MLIKALCDYADKKSASPNTDIIPDGFAKQDISYRIILSPEGDLLRIIELSKTIIIPKKIGNSTGINSKFIEHRPLYIFGLKYSKGEFTTFDDKNTLEKYHKAFVNYELEFFDDLNSEICTAYKKFKKKWNPETETNNDKLKSICGKYTNANFGFSLGVGKAELEKDAEFIKKYTKFYEDKQEEENKEPKLICGILGEKLPIERIHDQIKFPKGITKGQKSVCTLICMNEESNESYGKKQAYNSNVSKKAMKKYTTTFNSLLSDKLHHTIINDMTIVYFAMKNDDSAECSAFSLFFSNNSDVQTEQSIATIMQYAKGGYTTDQDIIKNLETDNDVTFYIAGFTTNISRICQKFIYRDKFGNILNNLIKHQNDMKINANSTRPIYFSDIEEQLSSPSTKSNKGDKNKAKKETEKSEENANKSTVSSSIMTSIMLSAFNGTKYPDALLSTIVRRVKTDRDKENEHYIKLNDTRAGIIKAYINRKYNKEEITMAWNEENKNPAYLCGGLFAIYEKIQEIASDNDLNRTITDAYFASACTRPSSVFITLSKLSRNHLRKIQNSKQSYLANKYDNLVTNIIDSLADGFPLTLDIDNQGRFIMGYYQMKNKLKPNGNKQDNNEINNIEE